MGDNKCHLKPKQINFLLPMTDSIWFYRAYCKIGFASLLAFTKFIVSDWSMGS